MVCLLALAFLAAPAFRSRAQSATYQITDLGTFTGGSESKAFGINHCGQVVGYSTISGAVSRRPFVTQAGTGTLINLGTFGGDAVANAINSSGHVAGYSKTGSGLDRAFIWRDGQLQDFLPSGAIGLALDINDSGLVVGVVDTSGGDNISDSAFVWDSATPGAQIQILNPANGPTPMRALGVNNLGHIVGTATNNHSFFFNGTTNVEIGTFGGTHSFAYAVSDDDYVTGYAEHPSPSMNTYFPKEAFIWTSAGGLKHLGTVGTDTDSIAYEIANVGNSLQGVGTSYAVVNGSPGPHRAFLWQDENNNGDGDPGEMKELKTLLANDPSHEWTNLEEALSINGSGQIAGFGTKNGETHAFLLTPTGISPPVCSTPSPSPSPTPTPDVTIGVSPAPASVTESGATNLTFTFTRTGSTTNPLIVNFAVGGSATFGNDYTQTGAATFSSSAGTVTIGAGNSSASVTVDPSPDGVLEGDETVTLTVTAGADYNVASPGAATGTITPDAPIVFTEMDTSNAVAVDSVTFVRGPFRLVDDHNFSGDHLTRVILITSNLGMTQQDLAQGILSVRVAGYANPLPIENVGTFTIAATPAFNVSYIVVRLPADLPNPLPGPNNLTLTVKLGSAESNATILSIMP